VADRPLQTLIITQAVLFLGLPGKKSINDILFPNFSLTTSKTGKSIPDQSVTDLQVRLKLTNFVHVLAFKFECCSKPLSVVSAETGFWTGCYSLVNNLRLLTWVWG
jgi:hypothetical protein